MSAEQQRRVFELCDMACRAISEGPMIWQTGLPVSIGHLRIEQRGLMRMARRAAGQQVENADKLPHGIDIFWRETKVLSVGWSRTSERQVICYEPGEWERELEFLLTPGHGRAQ